MSNSLASLGARSRRNAAAAGQVAAIAHHLPLTCITNGASYPRLWCQAPSSNSQLLQTHRASRVKWHYSRARAWHSYSRTRLGTMVKKSTMLMYLSTLWVGRVLQSLWPLLQILLQALKKRRSGPTGEIVGCRICLHGAASANWFTRDS